MKIETLPFYQPTEDSLCMEYITYISSTTRIRCLVWFASLSQPGKSQ